MVRSRRGNLAKAGMDQERSSVEDSRSSILFEEAFVDSRVTFLCSFFLF